MAGMKKSTDAECIEADADAMVDPDTLFDRRDRVAALWLRGYTQKEIGGMLGGLSQGTVSRDLAWVREQWAARSNIKVHEMRAEQVAKLDALQREYWHAWERSQGEIEKTVESTNRTNGDTLTITTETVAGDPRYLQGVERCIEQVCDILGLKAPQRSEVSQTVVYVEKELADGV